MILLQWLTFPFVIYSFFNKLHFPTMYSNLLLFRIYEIHSYSIIFKNILSSSSFLFFPSSPSFSFHLHLFSSFPICPFSFPYFPLFFPNLHHFLDLVCHFLRAPLPCSRTFCCPAWQTQSVSTKETVALISVALLLVTVNRSEIGFLYFLFCFVF